MAWHKADDDPKQKKEKGIRTDLEKRATLNKAGGRPNHDLLLE